MKLFKFLIIFSALILVSCSKGKKKEMSDVSEEVMSEDADFIVDAEDEELFTEDSEPLELTEEEVPLMDEPAQSMDQVPEAIASTPIINSNQMGSYQVKKNDTLMMIAFKIHGDYTRWRELKNLNGLRSSNISEGMTIQYKMDSQSFSWNPQGLPYLIKVGDSLVTISNDKYGTPNKWKNIYDNNRPLIRDPNLIFAGFTLYYLSARDIASE